MIKQQFTETVLINSNYYHSLLKDINKAQHTIDLEVYIFANDEIGNKIADALCTAAERGVKVRVLVDGVGTSEWGGNIKDKLMRHGVMSRVYHPFPWLFKEYVNTNNKTSIFSKILFLLYQINRRNHRKTCVIDQTIVYIGSANIKQCHLNKDDGGENWRDTTIRLEAVDTRRLNQAFERAWNRFPLYERAKLTFKKAPKNPIFRLNYSRHQRRVLYKALIKKIAKSRTRVWITNSYFIPEAKLLNKIMSASKRGVDVRIILPHTSDVFIYPLISKVFYQKLMDAGVKIYEYMPAMLHAKVLIVDDWCCVGSSNLNNRSIRHDLEVDINLQTKSAMKMLESQFLDDIDQSIKIDKNNLSEMKWYQKLLGLILLHVQYWL